MKKVLYFIAICLVFGLGSSCKKLDNYPEPEETLTGAVVDEGTGKTVQTETGDGGTRVKLLETSWSDSPTPFYINSMQDGTFNYTKLFAGTNKITVEGAFVPLVQTDDAGNVNVDKSQTVEIKGVTTINFSVAPFLRVEWVGDPVYNADGTITASFKFTRGTTDPKFQLDISDAFLFISTTKYLGNNEYDNRYSAKVTYQGSAGNNLIGQTISLTTTGGALPDKRDYFLRVGVRVLYGLNYYNYNEVKTVTVP